MSNPTLNSAILLVARLMLAAIFIQSGYGKIAGYNGAATYMQNAGVPGQLLPLVIITELGFGILFALGWYTRLMAFLLAGFTLVAAVLFHLRAPAGGANIALQVLEYLKGNVADQMQMIHFMKNIAIAGGFLSFVAHGPGGWSIDGASKG